MTRRHKPLLRVLAIALAFAGSAAAAVAQEQAKAGGLPLPLDLAFSRKTLRRWQDRPAVSADGSVVAFEVFSPPARSPESEMAEGIRFLPGGTPGGNVGLRVWVASTRGGEARSVCPEKGNCWRPSLSRDGKRVAFFSDADGAPRLWVADVAGGTPRRLSEDPVKARHWPGDDAQWSPDGRELFVPLRPAGQTFSEPATKPPDAAPPGAPLEKPTVIVYKTGGEAAPAAAPAGGATPAAMMEHFMRENASTIAAIDVATGKARVLVPSTATPTPSTLRLSPDGKWVSYLSVFKMKGETSSEVFYDLAVVPAAGGAPRVVASDVKVPENDYFGATYRWLPGSTRMAVWKDQGLWIYDAAGAAKPQRLAASLGKLEEAPFLLTADGRAVLVGLEAEGEKTYYSVPPKALALVPLDGSAPKTFPTVGAALAANLDTLWSPAPDRFALVVEDQATGERSVVSVDAKTGATQTLWKGHGRLEAVGAAPGGIVARFESLDVPPDLYLFPPTFASKQRLTHVEPRFDGVAVGPMEMFASSIPGFDGRLQTVQSAAFFPPGGKTGGPFPTIVYFYSGSRVGASAQDYGGGAPNSIPVQVFATRGYAVLLLDVPLGPQGKGGNPIQEMGDAILAQVYRAAALGYTDPTRVAIMGQSYGGYSTAAMITQSNLFRAAIALDGLYDLAGDYARMGPGGGTFNFVWSETGQGRMGTHPWADLRRFLANSPYYQVDKIHTPLLLIHGKKDDTCPVEGAEKMFNALKRLERTCELAIYDGEGHVPGDWSLVNAVDATQRMVDFLEKHARGAAKSASK